MAKASSATAGKVADYGVATDRSSQLDGYTVNFVTITKTHDLGPVLASLPGGNCSCPHWGYVLKGRVVVRYADRQETLHRRCLLHATRPRARSRRGHRTHPVQPHRTARRGRGGHRSRR